MTYNTMSLFKQQIFNNFDSKIKTGVSVISCCMNRNENLKQAIQNWLKFSEIDEIIIVDWSSNKLVSTSLSTLRDSRVKIFRVNNETNWVLSYAFNLAASLSSKSQILKLDSDVLLQKNFFNRHKLGNGNNKYFAGNWKSQKQGLSGVLFIPRSFFFRINGYNEFIRTYGWDDIDLYDRLDRYTSLERQDIDPSAVSVLHHPQSASFSKQSDCVYHSEIAKHPLGKFLLKEREFQNMKNRYISQKMQWGIKFQRASYYMMRPGILERIKDREYAVPNSIMLEAEKYAIVCLLNLFYKVNIESGYESMSDLLNIYEKSFFKQMQSRQYACKYDYPMQFELEQIKKSYFEKIKENPYQSRLYLGLSQIFEASSQENSYHRALQCFYNTQTNCIDIDA